MADFDIAFKKFKTIEFSGPENVLHRNSGEKSETYYGIYRSAHPDWEGWKRVDNHLDDAVNTRHASIESFRDERLTEMVKKFYKNNFWDKIRLDEIKSQKIAEEMFFFYINTGDKSKAVKYAQEIVGAKQDGVIGEKTIKALNDFSESIFDVEYDIREIVFYEHLASKNPKRYLRFLDGWKNRARKI
jgi:lysozyme family protein